MQDNELLGKIVNECKKATESGNELSILEIAQQTIQRYCPIYGNQGDIITGGESFNVGDTLEPYANATERKPVLKIDETPVFTEGDISAIIGAAKSRKTLLAAEIAGRFLNSSQGDIITSDTDGKLLYIDTEQSTDYSQRTLNNIANVAQGGVDRLKFVNQRKLSRYERLLSLVILVHTEQPKLVIIDGVADLMNNSNDIEEAQQITSLLMATAETTGCHICSVLHTPPTSAGTRGRGHIGSELERKCETIIHVSKDESGEKSEVSPAATRGRAFQKFTIEHGTNGEPIARRITSTADFLQLVRQKAGKAELSRKQLTEIVAKTAEEAKMLLTETKRNNKISNWIKYGEIVAKNSGKGAAKVYRFTGEDE